VASGEGGVGNAVDQVLLYCFQYDPETGRYSAAIFNIVRIAGLVTLVAMAGFFLSISTRRRKKTSPRPPAESSP